MRGHALCQPRNELLSTAPATGAVAARRIVPCLAFDGRAAEAIELYVSTFKNSRLLSLVRSPMHPGGEDMVLHAEFELNGVPFTAMDGGPSFRHEEGFSIAVTVDTQEEIDAAWARLSEGGEEQRCGWLKDRFGVSWQVIPRALEEMMSQPEGGDVPAVVEAFMKMKKFDVAALERAYRGK